MDLESLLDDTIVEAAGRRRAYPKKILPHVVHSLRAERSLMVGVWTVQSNTSVWVWWSKHSWVGGNILNP